jgi:hypothetical protein
MLQAAISKSKARIDARSAVQTELHITIIVIMSLLFIFTIICIISKLETAIWVCVCSLQEKGHLTPVPVPLQASAGHFRHQPSYQQSGGDSSAFVLPHVICKTDIDTNLKQNNQYNESNEDNVNNKHICLFILSFRFKSHKPENIVVPVQDMDLLDEQANNGQMNMHDLHIDLSIQRDIK